MSQRVGRFSWWAFVGGFVLCAAPTQTGGRVAAGEPPAINPFGSAQSQREDAIPGYIEMSDGSIHYGRLYMTRDKRLKLNDAEIKENTRQREIPLRAVKQIECSVLKEWMEREWRFKELAADEKMYTGRSYPAREYSQTLTLSDGRAISGELSGIIYLQPGDYGPPRPGELRPEVEPEQFILHKRDKGEPGTDLNSLRYAKLIKLGEEAFQEGKRKAAGHQPPGSKSRKTPATKKR